MAQTDRVQSRIQSLEERLARIRAQKTRLLARASRNERKRDTRRKILIGGAVLAAIEHEGVPKLRTREELLGWLEKHLTRAHDRAVFDLPAREENGDVTRFRLMSDPVRIEAAVKDGDHREPPRSGAARP
jgi:hypothetical protein